MRFPTGTKIKLWTGGYTNKPWVDPPWLLKLVAVLAFLSTIGSILYVTLNSVHWPGTPELSTEAAIYVVVLHFIVPVTVFYSVTVNSPASRLLILGYTITLYLATISNKGFLGTLAISPPVRDIVATLVLIAVAGWLFLSPKLRFYYALLSGDDVPADLESRAATFADESKLNPRVRAAIDWFADHLETIVLLGLAVLAVYAVATTG